MSIRMLVSATCAVGVVSLVSLGAILLLTIPESPGAFGLIFFTISLLLVLSSLWTIVGLSLRKKFITERNHMRVFVLSLRQGALISAVIVVWLWLAHFDRLSALVGGILLVAALILEYFLLIRKRHVRA